jgi:hypothetical protein
VANEGNRARSSSAEAIEIEGIKVAPPLTKRQAHSLMSHGLLADSADTLIGAWLRVASMWAELLNRHEWTLGDSAPREGQRRVVLHRDAPPSHFVTDGSEWVCSVRKSGIRSAFHPILL